MFLFFIVFKVRRLRTYEKGKKIMQKRVKTNLVGQEFLKKKHINITDIFKSYIKIKLLGSQILDVIFYSLS